MAWQARQHNAAFGNPVTNVGVALTPRRVGNLIVVGAFGFNEPTDLTIADTQGHTWVQVNANDVRTGQDACESWYAIVISLTATTITVTKGGTSNYLTVLVSEFDGRALPATILDQTGVAQGAGTPTSTAETPTEENELIWAATVDVVTGVGAGYVKGADDGDSDWSEYRILPPGDKTAQTATFVGGAHHIMIATFICGPEIAGGLADDRYRFRHAQFVSGTSTLGTQRSAWPDDARDFGQRDAVADHLSRMT